MPQLKRATFVVEKCRNGWYVQVHTDNPEYDPRRNRRDPFIIPGEDLDPAELGRQVVASIVGNRVAPKKRR